MPVICTLKKPNNEQPEKAEAVLKAVDALLAEVAREKGIGKLGLPK